MCSNVSNANDAVNSSFSSARPVGSPPKIDQCDMQSIDLKTDSSDNLDTENCQRLTSDVMCLREQVADLNEVITNLKNSVCAKDAQLEEKQRDTEKLTSELKKQQRYSRNLKQQLDDERYYYQRNKYHFNERMASHECTCTDNIFKTHHPRPRHCRQICNNLEDENEQLKQELNEKSEITYNLCIKFLRMKHTKDSLARKLEKLLSEHLQVMAEMMDKLDDAREELNIIVSEKFQEPLPLSKAKFLQVVQKNTRLVHENAKLKVQIQHLIQNIEKLQSQKQKTFNLDPRIIAKLATNCRKKGSEEFDKLLPASSRENKTEEAVNKCTIVGRPQAVAQNSGDAKILSKFRMKTWQNVKLGKEDNNHERHSIKFENHTTSSPEIVKRYSVS